MVYMGFNDEPPGSVPASPRHCEVSKGEGQVDTQAASNAEKTGGIGRLSEQDASYSGLEPVGSVERSVNG